MPYKMCFHFFFFLLFCFTVFFKCLLYDENTGNLKKFYIPQKRAIEQKKHFFSELEAFTKLSNSIDVFTKS